MTGAVRDISVAIEILVVANGEYVANRNRAQGVRVRDGEPLNWVEHEIWRVDDGRLAEQWSVADGLNIG